MRHLLLPGLYGSGPRHWQRWWLDAVPGARLVEQRDWQQPRLDDWRRRLAGAVSRAPGAILVAHSLACALVAHLARRQPELPIGGALLVAPADVDDPSWMAPAVAGFGPMPLERLPFPAIVVASHNDPYVAFERARAFAARWGAELVDAGSSGHLNAEGGFGPWPAGVALARRLVAEGQRGAHEADSRDEERRLRLTLSEVLGVGYHL